MQRKEFMKFIAASVATGSFISLLEACSKNNTTPAAANVDFTLDITSSSNLALQNSGGSVINSQVIVINNNGSYVALSDICTHQGCSLGYNGSKLTCPCHGATFNLSGSVLSGPASSSLKQYTVTRAGNILHITG